MVKTLIVPRWWKPVLNQQIDRNFLEFDNHVWAGNVKNYWERSKDYSRYLRQERTIGVGQGTTEALNYPEAYQLLENNIDRILKGETIEWAVDIFGYEKTFDVSKKAFIPRRGRFFLGEDGKEVQFGGITDGDYVNLTRFLSQVYYATFYISKPIVFMSWHQLNLQELIDYYKKDDAKYAIVDINA